MSLFHSMMVPRGQFVHHVLTSTSRVIKMSYCSSLKAIFSLCLIASLLLCCFPAMGEDNGVGLTPVMGWSTWSFLRKNVNQTNVEAQALAMHSSALQGLGFQYINLDDFWYLNPSQSIDSYGRWVPDTSKFPDGLPAVATYVHSLGLKFGMYLTPGIPVAAYKQNTPIEGTSYTAQNIVSDTSSYASNYNYGSGVMYHIDYTKPGAQAFLNSWANQLASWGVDYVKLDGVGSSYESDVQGWGTALAQTGRPIHLEISNSMNINDGAFWRKYSNGWRISGDIEAYGTSHLTNWNNVSSRFTSTPGWQEWGGPGGFSDLDSLEIGNGSQLDGLSTDQLQSTETLWAIAASPLILGSDLTNLDSGDVAQLSNRGVINIDQNGVPGAPVFTGTTTVWRARQNDGSYAVALFNLGSSSANVTADWSTLGFTGKATVYDMWGETSLGTLSDSYSVTLNSDASALIKVKPQIPVYQYLADSPSNTLSGRATTHMLIPTATDGVSVGNLGDGGVLTFNNVLAGAAGTYNLTILYFDGDSGRSMSVSTNGGTATSYAFAGTGSWTALGSKTVQVQLKAGANTIVLSNPSGYAPDVDSISTQATTAPPALGTGSYEIQSALDGMALNVSGDSKANTAAIIQYPFTTGQTNALWTFVPTSNGYYQITNVNSGLDIAVSNASVTMGAFLLQYSYGSAGNDQWEISQNTDGTYSFFNLKSGMVLEDPGSNKTMGTQYDQWLFNGGANQKFNLIAQ